MQNGPFLNVTILYTVATIVMLIVVSLEMFLARSASTTSCAFHSILVRTLHETQK